MQNCGPASMPGLTLTNKRHKCRSTLGKIDRFALDAKCINFLAPSETTDELFFAEDTRKVHEDIKSRITFSANIKKLNPEDMQAFLLREFDKAGLGHNTFTEDAMALVVRSAAIIRRAKNLCPGSLLEAVRRQKRTIDTANVNRVLISACAWTHADRQPHWRTEYEPELINLSTGSRHRIKKGGIL